MPWNLVAKVPIDRRIPAASCSKGIIPILRKLLIRYRFALDRNTRIDLELPKLPDEHQHPSKMASREASFHRAAINPSRVSTPSRWMPLIVWKNRQCSRVQEQEVQAGKFVSPPAHPPLSVCSRFIARSPGSTVEEVGHMHLAPSSPLTS